MKKSLQYILIMSIFGMQTEYLFAKTEDKNRIPTPSGVQDNFVSTTLPIEEMNVFEDSMRNMDAKYGARFDWDEYETSKTNSTYGDNQVNLSQLIKALRAREAAIFGIALAQNQRGQDYLLRQKDGNNDFILGRSGEAFRKSILPVDPVTTSAVNFILAHKGKTIDEFSDREWFPVDFSDRYRGMLKNTKINDYNFSDGVPVSLVSMNLAAGTPEIPIRNDFNGLIDSPARTNGIIDPNIIVTPKFNPGLAGYLIVAMGSAPWGVDYIGQASPELQKGVVEKILSLGTNNKNDKLLLLSGTTVIFKAKGINPDGFKITSEQVHLLFEKQLKLVKDTSLDLKERIKMTKTMLLFKKEMDPKIQREFGKAMKVNIISKFPPRDRQRIEEHLNRVNPMTLEYFDLFFQNVDERGEIKKAETFDKKPESERVSPKTDTKNVKKVSVDVETDKRDIVKSQGKTEKKK